MSTFGAGSRSCQSNLQSDCGESLLFGYLGLYVKIYVCPGIAGI